MRERHCLKFSWSEKHRAGQITWVGRKRANVSHQRAIGDRAFHDIQSGTLEASSRLPVAKLSMMQIS